MSSLIERAAARSIGVVESVAPDKIIIALDHEAPQAVALNAGEPQRFPRINAFVLVPNEVGATVGVVSWMGVERSRYGARAEADRALVDLPFPWRKIAVTPLGTLRRRVGGSEGEYQLERGVLAYPSVGDRAQLPSPDELRALVEARGPDARVVIGTSPLAADAAVSVDPDKLFGRHLAVLGNTGSGKSCSVAGIIRWSLEAAEKAASRAPHARFVVLDPNGEYRTAFGDLGDIYVVEAQPEGGSETSDAGGATPASESNPLRVPAWMWNSREWAAFAQAAPGTQRPLLMQALRNLRTGRAIQAGAGVRLAQLVRGHKILIEDRVRAVEKYTGEYSGAKRCGEQLQTLSSDAERYLEEIDEGRRELEALLQRVNQLIDDHRRAWTDKKTGKLVVSFRNFTQSELLGVRDDMAALLEQLPEPPVGGGAEDAPLPFDPGEMAQHLEALAWTHEFSEAAGYVGTLVLRVRSILSDTRLRPILDAPDPRDLTDWLESHLGGPEPGTRVTVIDLSMVPAEVVHLVVAVIARVIFEALQRHRKLTGTVLPTALVLEEAHTFVRARRDEEQAYPTPGRMCRDAFERIAREGRKFGLGLVLSSQRPSELSPTVLAQCNTFLLHRLVNDVDQSLVGRLVPDNLGGLLNELPSLPSQQAILLGWASPVPVLVRMRDLAREHRPQSADPDFWDVWVGEEERISNWRAVVADWTKVDPDASPHPDGET